MPIADVELTKDGIESGEPFKNVKSLAEAVREFLNRTDIGERVRAVDITGALSLEVQELILPFVKGLGFESERKRIFANFKCPSLRPDYFHAKAG